MISLDQGTKHWARNESVDPAIYTDHVFVVNTTLNGFSPPLGLGVSGYILIVQQSNTGSQYDASLGAALHT